jgi:hypothetical protein
MAKQEMKKEDEVKAAQKVGGKIPLDQHPAFKGAPDLSKAGKLVSRLDHPVTIAYNGEALIIPPRAQGIHAIVILNTALLGALPAGVQLLKM